MKFHKILFYLLVLTLPLNLGKHFVFNWCYVNGILVDYLIPTLFVQDVVLVLLLVFWLRDRALTKVLKRVSKESAALFALLFLFSVFLSVTRAERVYPAIYSAIKTFLYAGLFFYVLVEFDFEKERQVLAGIFALLVLLVSVLGIAQFFNQGAIFNNYVFFGEQPYSFSTPNVAKESFLGVTRIPPYSTFRHPNTLAGFLAILLVWVFYLVKKTRHKFYVLTIGLGAVCLFLTLSKIGLVLFAVAIGFLVVWSRLRPPARVKVRPVMPILAVAAVVLGLTVHLWGVFPPPFSGGLQDSLSAPAQKSIVRRVNFNNVAMELVKEAPMYGVGPNNFTVYFGRLNPLKRDFNFLQPVHNIFWLILAESGIIALLFFSALLFRVFQNSLKNPYTTATMFLLVSLSGFDHFFVTAHQTQILFWLLIGVCATLNVRK